MYSFYISNTAFLCILTKIQMSKFKILRNYACSIKTYFTYSIENVFISQTKTIYLYVISFICSFITNKLNFIGICKTLMLLSLIACY